ncbi:MAG: histidine phosphatase family protein [Actinomycetota bacterium]|nr:histidine phosphatase family protein [Actinomycetota bacterium]
MEDAPKPAAHRQSRFQTPPGATEILLVRHGESAPFVPGQPFELIDGQGDPPLAPQGVVQAERVGERLREEHIDALYVTTMRRTHETAAPLAAHLAMVPKVEADLREVHLGEWEGGVLRQKAAENDPIYQRMHVEQDWGLIPGAESNAELSARVVGAIGRIHAAHPDEKVVCFVHGGVIAALCGHATGAGPFAFAGADNGSIHHLVVHDEMWRLRCYNDTGHLGRFTVAPEGMT